MFILQLEGSKKWKLYFPPEGQDLPKEYSPDFDQSQIGPTNLRVRYNVTDKATNSNNRQAVAEFQEEYFSPSDLSSFWTKYVNYAPAQTVTKVIGKNQVTITS